MCLFYHLNITYENIVLKRSMIVLIKCILLVFVFEKGLHILRGGVPPLDDVQLIKKWFAVGRVNAPVIIMPPGRGDKQPWGF